MPGHDARLREKVLCKGDRYLSEPARTDGHREWARHDSVARLASGLTGRKTKPWPVPARLCLPMQVELYAYPVLRIPLAMALIDRSSGSIHRSCSSSPDALLRTRSNNLIWI
jgi:hypothetical protein